MDSREKKMEKCKFPVRQQSPVTLDSAVCPADLPLALSGLGNCNASAERTVLHVLSAAWAVEKTLKLVSACHILLHVLQAVGAELLQYPARNECCLQLQSSSRWPHRAVLQSPCVLQQPGCSWHLQRVTDPGHQTHTSHNTQRHRKMRKLIQLYFSILPRFFLSLRIKCMCCVNIQY